MEAESCPHWNKLTKLPRCWFSCNELQSAFSDRVCHRVVQSKTLLLEYACRRNKGLSSRSKIEDYYPGSEMVVDFDIPDNSVPVALVKSAVYGELVLLESLFSRKREWLLEDTREKVITVVRSR